MSGPPVASGFTLRLPRPADGRPHLDVPCLIEWYDYNARAPGWPSGRAIRRSSFSDWPFHAIDAAEALSISGDYLRLRRPPDRRVYEIGAKHSGAAEVASVD